MILLFIQNISPFLVGHIRLMTSKVQQRLLNIYQEKLGTRLSCFGTENKKSDHFTQLISPGRIKQTIK